MLDWQRSGKILSMIVWLRHVLGWVVGAFRSREDIILENLALRQQLLALHAQRPRRRLTASHKLFWVVLRKCWARWKEPLIQVIPRIVIGWHRAGFRLYWKWLSRAKSRGGRKPVSKEIRALIFQMVADNPTWGAPRIHGELLKLGFDLSEPTVSRWVRRAPRPPDLSKRWLTFLRNHREAIAAMNFFTVPTLTFGVLYCFFVIGMGSQPIRTAFRSPWQNGIAERWVGSVRRDLLDHVIVLNQKHLRRLLNEYVRYYHEDRTHLGLGKDTPGGRVAASPPSSGPKVISLPRLGGLHHRYTVAA